MKSTGINVGNVNLKGKKAKRLRCGCCTAHDLRTDELKKVHLREMKEYKSMQS